MMQSNQESQTSAMSTISFHRGIKNKFFRVVSQAKMGKEKKPRGNINDSGPIQT